MRSRLRLAGIPALLAAMLFGQLPAAAQPPRALPETVRVNIAGLGTPSATIGSTGAMTVSTLGGAVLYRGGSRTVARRDVYRLEDHGIRIPDRDRPPEPAERPTRAALLREARIAQRDSGPRAVVVVPFELAVLSGLDDPIGQPLLSRDRIVPLRFVADDGLLVFNGKAFRGTLDLTLDDDGDMIVVNTVRTADYLASVVGAEVPTTWAPQALAAQAIAARTYLATHLRRHRNYDLEGDVRDQAYSGFGTETDSTVRAVERTAGIIATYRGAAIEALYSANAGGVTEDSENVFTNALPYLRSVSSPTDQAASNSSWGRTSWEWTREITAPQLGDHLRVRGVEVGTPQRIELTQLSASGRVLRARVVGTRGGREIFKDSSRYYFGLRSSLFTVDLKPGGDVERVDYKDTDRLNTLEALGAQRTATLIRASRSDGEHWSYTLSGYSYELPARFVFSGRGFGHGVGMSQWGMQGMAEQGATAEQILKHYYRGIALTNIGGV